MKLLQGVAWDELLIRIRLHPVLPSHPDFVGVGVGVGVCSIHLLLISRKWEDWGGPCWGPTCLEKKTYPRHQGHTMQEKGSAVRGGTGFGALYSNWKPNGYDFWG